MLFDLKNLVDLESDFSRSIANLFLRHVGVLWPSKLGRGKKAEFLLSGWGVGGSSTLTGGADPDSDFS